MAHQRRTPYACARCGVVGHDSKGIPVLTVNGLVESYEVPFGWGYIGRDLGCDECLIKFTSELGELDAQRICENLVSVLTANWAEYEAKTIARACDLLGEYYRKRVSDGH